MEDLKIDNINLNKIDPLKNSYENSEVANMIKSEKKRSIKCIIDKIAIYSESNDLLSFNLLYEQILYLKKNKNFSKNNIEIMIHYLDKMISKNYKNITAISRLFSLMNKLITFPGLKIVLDWKAYYQIYFIYFSKKFTSITKHYTNFVNFTKIFFKFLKKSNKFFKFTEEEYKSIRNEVIENLYFYNPIFLFYLSVIEHFFPSEFLKNDDELQIVIFNIVYNRCDNTCANITVLNIFKKIVKSGIKVPIDKFIDTTFELMNEIILNNYSSSSSLKKSKPEYKRILYLISAFIFSNDFESYENSIIRKFKILINIIDAQLNENTHKSDIDKNIKFLKLLISSFQSFTFKKDKIQISEFEQEKDFIPIESKQAKLKTILSMMKDVITKSFFYTSGVKLLSKIQLITSGVDYMDIFEYLYDKSYDDYGSFISKCNCFLKNFLINYDNVNISRFLNSIISNSINNINSVNLDQNINILTFFTELYLRCIKLKTETENLKYNKLFLILRESSIEILNRMLNLFDMFVVSHRNIIYNSLIIAITSFNDLKTNDKIFDSFVSYLKENVLDSNQLNFYFSSIYSIKNTSRNKYMEIWDYCYESFLIEKDENIDKQNHYLLENTHCYKTELINKKKLIFLKKILSLILYNYIPSDDEFKKKLNILISTLFNQTDVEYHKIGCLTLSKIVSDKLSPKIISYFTNDKLENKISYPDTNDQLMFIELYEIYLKPYYNYITDIISKFEEELNKSINNENLSEKEKKKHSKKIVKKILLDEKVVSLYLSIERIFTNSIDNPFIIREISQSVYSDIIKIRKELKEFHFKLYDYLKYFNLIESITINKLYCNGIINQNYDYSNNYFKSRTTENKCMKFFYKNLRKKEKIIIEFNKIHDEMYSHIRLTKVFIKSDEIDIKNIKLLSKLYVNNTNKKFKTDIVEYIKNCFLMLKINKKDIKKLNNNIFKNFEKIISNIKIENNIVSITDKNKIENIISFYRTLMIYMSIYVSSEIINIIENALKLIKIASEKRYSELHTSSISIITNIYSIINQLPNDFYLIDNKLIKYPFVESLKHSNYVINSKAEKHALYRPKIEKRILSVQEKTNNLRIETLKFLNNFSDKLKNHDISSNIFINHLITLTIINSVKTLINPMKEDEFKILSKFEEILYFNLFSDIPHVQRNISLYSLGIILQMKYKYSKHYVFIPTDNMKLINESKNKIDGFGNKYTNFKFKDIKYSEVVLNQNIFNSLHNDENIVALYKFISNFKDLENDQIIMKNNFSNLTKDHFQILDNFVEVFKNHKLQNLKYLDASALFNHNQANILYYLFFLYRFSNYEIIFSIFDSNLKSNSDNFININSLLHILAGMVKTDLIYKNYKNIHNCIIKIMKYYTSGINKKIDNDILSFFHYLLGNCSVLDFKKIFLLDSENLVFKFGEDFVTKLIRILQHTFIHKIKYLFDNDNILKLENIENNYFASNIKVLKNTNFIDQFVLSNIFIKGGFDFDNDNFKYIFSDSLKDSLLKLNNYAISLETKEIKKLQICFFTKFAEYMINNLDLLFIYLEDIIKLAHLDSENFENITSQVKNKFKKHFNNFNLTQFLSSYENILNSTENLQAKKFITDLFKIILRYNSDTVNEISTEKIFWIINNSQFEIKEYICDNILSIMIFTLDNTQCLNLIQFLKDKISNHELKPISGVFILGVFLNTFKLIVPDYIQKVIITFKEYNNRLFKNRGNESKIIKNLVSEFFGRYKYTYEYAKISISDDCILAIEQLSKSQSYFL